MSKHDFDDVDMFVQDVKSLGWVRCERCKTWHTARDNYDTLCDHCCHVIMTLTGFEELKAKIQDAYQKQREIYGIKAGPQDPNIFLEKYNKYV